jgi:hypothetical protein
MKKLLLYSGVTALLLGTIIHGYRNDSYSEPAPKALELMHEDGLELLLRPVPMRDACPNIAQKSSDPKDWGEDFCNG